MSVRLPPWLLDARIVLHILLVAVMMWLSVDLQLPGDTLLRPGWSAFAAYGDEQQWSYAFLVAAMIGVVGLVSSYVWAQRVSILALSCAHITIAWLFWQAESPDLGVPPGAGIYTIIAAAGYWLALRRFVG